MSRDYTYVTFKNKVPGTFQRMKCSGFEMDIPVERGYEKAKRRVVIVIGKVPTDDLQENRLLGGEFKGQQVMENTIEQAFAWARKFGEVENCKFAFVNFNYFKTFNLSDEARRSANKNQAKRVKKFIKRMKPHSVIVFGDEAMQSLMPHEQHLQWRRGSVFDYPDLEGTKIVSTIEWADVMPVKKDTGRTMIDKANMLGYVSRCMAHGLLGKHPLSLAKLKPKAVNVTSLAMYKKMMRKMRASQAVAVDTETGGLNVLRNKIATIQFANSAKKGYVVILDHMSTPFNDKELKYIKKDLQAFFSERQQWQGRKDTKYLIFHNGKFDLRIIRAVLKVPFIYWPVWDTLAGEFCLDENLGYLSKLRTGAFNLAHMFARYDNPYYYFAEFGKADRHTLCNHPIGKKELAYCAMDVQSIWAVHKMQQATASVMDFAGKSYLDAYCRLVLVQMSNNIHQMSSMVLRGNDLDLQYLMHIASKKSPIVKLIDEEKAKLYAMPSVKKVNEKLAGSSGVPTTGLFGKAKTPWVFSLNTEDHKQQLYIKHLKLEPLVVNPDSGKAKLDKWFQKKHSDVPEVQSLSRIGKLNILRNTFATGILKKASDDPDVRVDGRLRPDYGYEGVVSGRSNSFGPSLQQIPEHSGEAKIIKRMFIAPEGKIHIKMDYSSHEVRGWGYISGDKQVAQSFQQIIDLINRFRGKPNEKTLRRMMEGGDIHKINYSMFTGVPVPKVTKEQRQSAKQIVFGSIYGMSAASLAEQLGMETEEAQALIDKFFSKASKAKKWLDFTAEHAREKLYAFSPLGRRRNLFANMTGNRRIMGGCDRRAQNAPIQGMSSDFGFNASRLMEQAIYEVFKKLGRDLDTAMLSAGVLQMVHDSIKLEMDYKDFYIIMWIVEYCAVYGLRKFIEETFNFKLNVDFAIEVEVGTSGDKFEKWDWRTGYEKNEFDPKDVRYGMKELVKKALENQRDNLGYSVNVKKVMKKMEEEGLKHRKMLRKLYPLPFEPF